MDPAILDGANPHRPGDDRLLDRREAPRDWDGVRCHLRDCADGAAHRGRSRWTLDGGVGRNVPDVCVLRPGEQSRRALPDVDRARDGPAAHGCRDPGAGGGLRDQRDHGAARHRDHRRQRLHHRRRRAGAHPGSGGASGRYPPERRRHPGAHRQPPRAAGALRRGTVGHRRRAGRAAGPGGRVGQAFRGPCRAAARRGAAGADHVGRRKHGGGCGAGPRRG